MLGHRCWKDLSPTEANILSLIAFHSFEKGFVVTSGPLLKLVKEHLSEIHYEVEAEDGNSARIRLTEDGWWAALDI